jgi:hypothetical protein
MGPKRAILYSGIALLLLIRFANYFNPLRMSLAMMRR